jgi:hypothetical protein
MGEVTKLPTQGHIFTALDYQMAQDRAARAAYQPGMMIKYPWPDGLPGWIRCNGMAVEPTVHPRLYAVLRGAPLPNDPEWLIKL